MREFTLDQKTAFSLVDPINRIKHSAKMKEFKRSQTKNRTRNLTEHSEKSASTSKTIYRSLTNLQVDNTKTQRRSINTEMLKHINVPNTDTFRWRPKKSKK